MTVNSYFTQFHDTNDTADQQLVEDLIIEMIQNKGTDFYYLPRTVRNFDSFFGEDVASSAFEDAYALEFYLESFKSWEGEGNILFKFGLESREEATLCCSIKRFKEEVTAYEPEILRPREGDIIVFPKHVDRANRFFEIAKVDQEEIHYQLGKLYTYKLQVRVFEYSGEHVDTGIAEIDAYENDLMFITEYELNPGAAIFTVGEVIHQTSGYQATVVSLEGNMLKVGKYKGQFFPGLPLIGSAGSRTIKDVTNPTKYEDALLDNDILEKLDDNGLIDTSENNPFLR